MKRQFVSYHLTVFDTVQIVEPSPDEVEPSLDATNHITGVKWSSLLLTRN